MAKVLILSGGGGRYDDPSHDYAGTSARIGDLAADQGHEVLIDSRIERRLAESPESDLLVFNASALASGTADTDGTEAARRGFAGYLAGGGPVLVVHTAITLLPIFTDGMAFTGGLWGEHTMHPPIGQASVEITPADHPITSGLADFTVHDERYSYVDTADQIVPLTEHVYRDRRHPLLWARTVGTSRMVYDALGHGVESYASRPRRALMRRSIDWLLRVR